jgi:hypothetical protein
MKGDSTALALIRNVWTGYGQAARVPRRDVGSIMHRALDLAIRSGLTFDREDFVRMGKELGGWSWGCTSEGVYSMACNRHVGACRAFEFCKGRPPFVLGGNRLHVDSALHWEGISRYAKVTSFADDGQSLTVCSYEPKNEQTKALYAIAGKPYGRTKIERRVKLTIGQIRAAERKNRAANKVRCHQAKVTHACAMVGLDVDSEAVRTMDEAQRTEALAWLADGRWSDQPMPKFLMDLTANHEALVGT